MQKSKEKNVKCQNKNMKQKGQICVYVMTIGNDDSFCKVGFTTNKTRRKKSAQTYSPHEICIKYNMKCKSKARAKRLERLVHLALRDHWVRGEWFKRNVGQCKDAIMESASKFREMSLPEIDAYIQSKW